MPGSPAPDPGLLTNIGLLFNRDQDRSAERGRTLRYFAINYIIRGSGVFQDANTPEQEVAAGSLFVTQPGVWHRYRPQPQWDEYFVTFDGEAVRHAFGDLLVGPPGHQRRPFDPTLARAFEVLHDLWLERPRHYDVRSRQVLHEILLRVFDIWNDPATEVGDDLVSQAKGLMKAQLKASTLDLRRFARERGISYERFRKRFAAETGIPPHRYWLNLKLRHAGTLLRSTRFNNVREVAAAVGISDAFYFSRLFRQHHGAAPLAFRQHC